MANLITLQDYKTAEGITQPKDDARLNVIIPSISQLVKTYCGISFVDYFSSNKTEEFNIDWATHIVQLTESPVNSIVSVEEREDYGSAYTTLTTGAQEYYLNSFLPCLEGYQLLLFQLKHQTIHVQMIVALFLQNFH